MRGNGTPRPPQQRRRTGRAKAAEKLGYGATMVVLALVAVALIGLLLLAIKAVWGAVL